jgi:hypothetical protein
MKRSTNPISTRQPESNGRPSAAPALSFQPQRRARQAATECVYQFEHSSAGFSASKADTAIALGQNGVIERFIGSVEWQMSRSCVTRDC